MQMTFTVSGQELLNNSSEAYKVSNALFEAPINRNLWILMGGSIKIVTLMGASIKPEILNGSSH